MQPYKLGNSAPLRGCLILVAFALVVALAICAVVFGIVAP
jgi:hypothetical protein